MAEVAALAKGMKGIDTSGVEVDDDQEEPTIAVGSSEEKEALKQMQALLADDLKALPEATQLMCLRGRKYDPARGAETLQKLQALKLSLKWDDPTPQLAKDLASGKIVSTGSHDEKGRAVVWLRLRYHNPKESQPEDMGRAIATVMLKACENVDTQRNGIVLINDVTGIGLKNISPPAAKFVFGTVLPSLPIRVSRICLVRPPWFVTKVLFPIVSNFMSKKLKARILLCPEPEMLLEVLPKDRIPTELDGTFPFSMEEFAARLQK